MAEAKRTFYLLDEDGSLTSGEVGFDGGVPGDGEYVKAPNGKIETANPGHIAQLERYAATAGHPVSDKPPSKEKS